jgi:hypothetical protein
VVLKRVEVAALGAEVERDLRHLTGRSGVVGRKLASLLGLAVATASGRQHNGAGFDHVLAAMRPPAVRSRLERAQR